MDEKDFVTLITENQGLIRKVCFLYANDKEARQDLFQEIVLQLWRSTGTFRGESKITTWMYRIALNTAISGLRKRRRSLATEGLTESNDVADEGPVGPDKELIDRLYASIRSLNEVDRAIIMMALDEISYAEIALTIGITQNNVRVRMSRIKDRLRKKLIMR